MNYVVNIGVGFMPKVVHFELNVEDSERAIKFYKEVFCWKIEKWTSSLDYWMITAGEEKEQGIDGALQPRTDSQKSVIIISVPSVDEFVEKVVKAGGKVIQEKTAVRCVGYLAYCEDTEGIMFGILKVDPSAR